jgi:predicted HTH domain antitoxin
MTTVIIEDNNVQATSFVEYTRTLPFATVIEEKKISFEDACAECNAISVDEFINELEKSVKQRYHNATS